MTDSDIDDFLGARPRHRLTHWLSLAALVAAGVAAFVLLVRFYEGPDQPWYTAPIERADLTPLLTADGTLDGDGAVTLRAADDGVVQAVADPGDGAVAAGAPLVTFDTAAIHDDEAIASAGTKAAQAQLDAAQAEANDAHARLARFEDVWQRSSGRVPAQEEMDAARAAVTRTEAAVATATAGLEAMRFNGKAVRDRAAETVIRAPFAGYVTGRAVLASQPVHAGSPLLTMVPSLDRLIIHVPMSAAEAVQISPLAQARVLVGWMPEAGRTATLKRIDAADGDADDSDADKDVVYALDGAAGALRPGMAVRLEIPMPVRSQVLVVPNAALAVAPGGGSAAGNSAVYVVGDDRQPRAVPVSVGGTDGKRTEVQGIGLVPGMEVITGARGTGDVPPGAIPVGRNAAALHIGRAPATAHAVPPAPAGTKRP